MKQFKAEWQMKRGDMPMKEVDWERTVHELLIQHNALCKHLEEERLAIQDGTIADFLEKEKCACGKTNTLGAAGVEVGGYNHTVSECTEITQTITLPKPEWWRCERPSYRSGYLEALSDTSEASGILFKLED